MDDRLHAFAAALGAILALPVFTSWGQAVSLGLLLVLGLVAAYFYQHRADAADALALDVQPLLPGEARWLVSRDGLVLDSCTHEDETGIASGWAVGHPIAAWAPPGTPEAEHYRRAIEDRLAATFEARYLDAEKLERVARVALQPRSDGTVYCESWDVTGYVRRAEAAEDRATTAEGRVDRLMRYASEEAERLFNDNAAPPAGRSAP